MIKLYLVVFDDEYNQQEIAAFLDTQSSIEHWFHSFPNSIFVKTALSAKELFFLVENHFKHSSSLVVTELHGNIFGRMYADHWKYFEGFTFA